MDFLAPAKKKKKGKATTPAHDSRARATIPFSPAPRHNKHSLDISSLSHLIRLVAIPIGALKECARRGSLSLSFLDARIDDAESSD